MSHARQPARHSALYVGRVSHARTEPTRNAFRYRINLLYLDLAELDTVFAGRWLWSTSRFALARWRREDHLGDPRQPLDTCVRELVERETGVRPRGPIRLLTTPRYFGYGFNPVSFFYCFDAADEHVECIVAEVSNTPWRERHCYVLPTSTSEPADALRRWRLDKVFHVSPFMPMDVDYEWSFSKPALGLEVHMLNTRQAKPFFDVTLRLERRPISGPELARTLLRHPFLPAKVLLAIHWQALRLWWKKTPFHEHPKWKTAPPAPTR